MKRRVAFWFVSRVRLASALDATAVNASSATRPRVQRPPRLQWTRSPIEQAGHSRLSLKFIPILLALLPLAGTGCVSTNAIRLGAGPARPRLNPETVVIYRTADQVPGRYEEVALLHSTGMSGWTDEREMYQSMQRAAARLGANAVILDSVTEPGAGAKVAAAIFGVGAERKGKAVAIFVYAGTASGTSDASTTDRTPAPASSTPSTLTTGSGFFVTESGYFVTAAHVVERSDASVVIRLSDGRTAPARIIRKSSIDDIAILKAEGHFTPLPLLSGDSSAELLLGSSVFTIGFPNPGVQGLAPKLTSGQVSATAGLHDDSRHYQISVPIQPGNSGGPLIDARGNVAGIVFASLDDLRALVDTGSVPQTVNYAIKIAPVKYLLRSIPDLKEYPMPSPRGETQSAEQIAHSSALACALVVVGDTLSRREVAPDSPVREAAIEPTKPAEVAVPREPAAGWEAIDVKGPTILLFTEPAGAIVFINGHRRGTTTNEGLALTLPGNAAQCILAHELYGGKRVLFRVGSELGHSRITIPLADVPNAARAVAPASAAGLPPSPTPAQGRLHIVTHPSGARIYVNGVFGGTTTEGGLDVWSDAGPTAITISRQGFKDSIKAYDVVAGVATTIAVDLTPDP